MYASAMMSMPSPAVSRTVRTRSTFRCMPSAPSTGPHPNRSFIALKPCFLYFRVSAASSSRGWLYSRLA